MAEKTVNCNGLAESTWAGKATYREWPFATPDQQDVCYYDASLDGNTQLTLYNPHDTMLCLETHLEFIFQSCSPTSNISATVLAVIEGVSDHATGLLNNLGNLSLWAKFTDNKTAAGSLLLELTRGAVAPENKHMATWDVVYFCIGGAAALVFALLFGCCCLYKDRLLCNKRKSSLSEHLLDSTTRTPVTGGTEPTADATGARV